MTDLHDDDYYDFAPDIPDDYVLCPRCDGHQEVPCHCGGDLCICDNYGNKPCPLCGGEYGGEGYVPKETADKYCAKQAEFHAALRDAMLSAAPSPALSKKDEANGNG